ncbi:hypothetical protein H8958_014261 [Nasalis larvatus]
MESNTLTANKICFGMSFSPRPVVRLRHARSIKVHSCSKKGSKKGVTEAPKKDGKKRKRSHKETHVYIYKVLKQVHPDTVISSKAMRIMNSFVNDIQRIADVVMW